MITIQKRNTMKNVTKLPVEFTGTKEVKGFKFKQIEESNNCYIYEVTDESNKHYEVIRKLTAPAYNFQLKASDYNKLHEFYPNSKHFGTSAWTFRSKDKAQEKVCNIEKNLLSDRKLSIIPLREESA